MAGALALNDSFSPSILLTPSSILKKLSQFSFQPTCNSLPNQPAILFPTHLQFSSQPTCNSLPNQLAIIFPTNQLHGGPCFLEPGGRGGALPKPDVIVRAEHADWTGPSRGPPFWAGFQPDSGMVCPRRACLAFGRWCSFSVCPAEPRDFASENESLGRRWYAVASETRVASEMKAPWIVKGGNKIKGEK